MSDIDLSASVEGIAIKRAFRAKTTSPYRKPYRRNVLKTDDDRRFSDGILSAILEAEELGHTERAARLRSALDFIDR